MPTDKHHPTDAVISAEDTAAGVQEQGGATPGRSELPHEPPSQSMARAARQLDTYEEVDETQQTVITSPPRSKSDQKVIISQPKSELLFLDMDQDVGQTQGDHEEQSNISLKGPDAPGAGSTAPSNNVAATVASTDEAGTLSLSTNKAESARDGLPVAPDNANNSSNDNADTDEKDESVGKDTAENDGSVFKEKGSISEEKAAKDGNGSMENIDSVTNAKGSVSTEQASANSAERENEVSVSNEDDKNASEKMESGGAVSDEQTEKKESVSETEDGRTFSGEEADVSEKNEKVGSVSGKPSEDTVPSPKGKGDHHKSSQKESTVTRPDSKVKTVRVTNGKASLVRAGKQSAVRDTNQKATKRLPSTAARSPRTVEPKSPRSAPERSQKKTEKTHKINEKSQERNVSATPAKSKSILKKPSTNTDSSEKDKVSTTTQARDSLNNEPSGAAEPTTSSSDPPSSKAPSPVNGFAQGAAPQGAGVEQGKAQDGQGPKKTARTLLNRALMKRAASADKSPKAATPPQPGRAEASPSAETGGKGSSPLPSQARAAHKTHSMQSLAVPPAVLGPASADLDERVSLGSRRDSTRHSLDSSVSRKSMDIRLQSSQAVVAAGGGEDKPKSMFMHDDSMIRAAIPAMPVRLAVVCLLLNIVIPGSGTAVSGLSVLCCSKSRLSSKGDGKATTVCVNLCVGAAQLGTITFLLVGWFWALAWGVKMVILAVELRAEQRQQREKELQTLALRAFGSPGNLRRSLLPPV